MATQSLYRRYRPRRFSEIRGQEHVVRALRNAVIHSREGQGYLFSGPRGTGKTTSARVLAKVLNCTDAVDGEPCCACESCLAVEAGTSFDVHELDAASNNGVEAMRDLIEKASLGTPGRHKVYILDEVHMLSKGAEAALLKTLEEPPAHVVFVLATTDPQKVSATIRSRVQHLEFHLLPMDELDQHVRWVAQDAGLTISDEAFQSVLAQGGGSARDTLSALELVAASGGEAPDTVNYDEFIEAFIASDPGMALSALAHAVQQGRDSRALAQDIVRHLRDCFLSLMAPELVQLPDAQAARAADQAQRLGAAAIVRGMERLGAMLVEMRHAPDPRLLLDIALVQLTSETSGNDLTALTARLERLEKSVANGAAAASAAVPAREVPVDPSTGRKAIGGRVPREPVAPSATAEAASTAAAPPTAPVTTPPTGAPRTPATPAPTSPASTSPAPTSPAPASAAPTVPSRVASAPAAAAAPPPVPAPASSGAPASASPPTVAAAPAQAHAVAGDAAGVAARVAAAWQSEILPTMKPMARALFAAGHFVGERNGSLTFGLPNETHRTRCEQHRIEVQAAIAAHTGVTVPVALIVDAGKGGDGDDHLAPVVPLRNSGRSTAAAVTAPVDDDDDIDMDDLVDAPPGSVKTMEDRLSDAFPGSVFVDERN